VEARDGRFFRRAHRGRRQRARVGGEGGEFLMLEGAWVGFSGPTRGRGPSSTGWFARGELLATRRRGDERDTAFFPRSRWEKVAQGWLEAQSSIARHLERSGLENSSRARAARSFPQFIDPAPKGRSKL